MGSPKKEDMVFNVLTPLGFHVRVPRSYWELISTIKHPVMSGHELEVKETLKDPEEIRQSKNDSSIYSFLKDPESGKMCLCRDQKAS